MTLDQYSKWYTKFVLGALFPAIKKAAFVDQNLGKDSQRQKEFEINKNMLVIVNLVAIIEAHFLDPDQRKNIRKFENLATPLNHQINETYLSCFYYLRDSYAHHGEPILFTSSISTTHFKSTVNSGGFPFASISGDTISIDGTAVHELHEIALTLFGGSI